VRIYIKSNKVIIKNFEQKDINDEYLSWFDGKNKSLKYSRHYKLKYNRNILLKNYFKLKNKKNFFLSIFDKKNKLLIGTMIIYKKPSNSYDIGILIGNPKYQSKGFAYESMFLFIKYAFKKLNSRIVTAGALSNNLSMINLMKKLNMKKRVRINSYSKVYEIRKYL